MPRTVRNPVGVTLDDGRFFPMIKRGASIPAKATDMFFANGPEVRVSVSDGTRVLAKDDRPLGSLVVDLRGKNGTLAHVEDLRFIISLGIDDRGGILVEAMTRHRNMINQGRVGQLHYTMLESLDYDGPQELLDPVLDLNIAKYIES